MSRIICYHCFARFSPADMLFKCFFHTMGDLRALDPDHPDDSTELDDGDPLFFSHGGEFGFRKPPKWAPCPIDNALADARVCPRCLGELPYFVGRTTQQLVAITGRRVSGKTVYLWSLLHQLRHVLSRKPDPFSVAMFEDEPSHRAFAEMHRIIGRELRIPSATHRDDQLAPVIVRLLRGGNRNRKLCNLIFYDPPGEFFQSLTNIEYVRYLAHAAAIIFLVSPTGTDPGHEAARSSEALSHLAVHIRRELGLSSQARIRKPLAIALTRADESLFGTHGERGLVANLSGDQRFWRDWDRQSRQAIAATSQRCETICRQMNMNNLVNLARSNFSRVCFFAMSSLGAAPIGSRLAAPPRPVGVENPLFWAIRALD